MTMIVRPNNQPDRRRLTKAVAAVLLILLTGCVKPRPVEKPQVLADPPTARAALAPLREQAVQTVLDCSRSPDAFLRANAIEAAENAGDRVVPMIQLAMDDPHEVVRFSAVAMIGRLKLTELAPAAKRLLGDKSESVRAAAIFAMARCGETVDITPLGNMLGHPDPTVRGNAAMLLGLLGERSAIPMLYAKVKMTIPGSNPAREAAVRLQFAEAIARLGDQSNMNAIRSGAYSTMGEARVLAVKMMGDLRDFKMQPAIEDMLADPPVEQQLAAAGALAKMGSGAGLEILIQCAAMPLPMVRAQAAIEMGYFPHLRTAQALATLLADAEQPVRLAAAASILRIIKE